MSPNREQAKRLIYEIIRQSEGGLGKTLLFKAFWLAHLYYSKSARGYLTDWPIVRMPQGPGIDKGDSLLQDLVDNGYVKQSHEPKGPYKEINCKLSEKEMEGQMAQDAVAAIRLAVNYVKQHNAGSISELSHDFSRSWKNTPNGYELDIYSDLIPDDVYNKRRDELLEMKKDYEDLFK